MITGVLDSEIAAAFEFNILLDIIIALALDFRLVRRRV